MQNHILTTKDNLFVYFIKIPTLNLNNFHKNSLAFVLKSQYNMTPLTTIHNFT